MSTDATQTWRWTPAEDKTVMQAHLTIEEAKCNSTDFYTQIAKKLNHKSIEQIKKRWSNVLKQHAVSFKYGSQLIFIPKVSRSKS